MDAIDSPIKLLRNAPRRSATTFNVKCLVQLGVRPAPDTRKLFAVMSKAAACSVYGQNLPRLLACISDINEETWKLLIHGLD